MPGLFSYAKIIYVYLVSMLESPLKTGHCLPYAGRIWKFVLTLARINSCVSA